MIIASLEVYDNYNAITYDIQHRIFYDYKIRHEDGSSALVSYIAEYTVTDLAADAFTLAASFAGDINNNNAAEMPVDCYNVTFADWNVTIPSAWRGSTAADQKNHRATKLKKKRYLLLHL